YRGSTFGIERVRIGTPQWEVVEAIQYSAIAGNEGTQHGEAEVTAGHILTRHAYVPTERIWGPKTPHAPPYAGELAPGLAGAPDVRSGIDFGVADWSEPRSISVMLLIAATADAPVGKTSDGSVPMIPNALFPFSVDGELLRDGLLAD